MIRLGSELARLIETVEKARDGAEDGRIAEGFSALLRGLKQAERAWDAGWEWGDVLVEAWRDAGDSFLNRYGLPLG